MKDSLFDENDFLVKLFDAIPLPAFVVDENVRILFWNSAATTLIGPEHQFRQRGGDVLHCIHALETEKGCGFSEFCTSCIIRNSVNNSIREKNVCRKRTVMELQTGDQKKEISLLVTTSYYEFKQMSLAILILEDIHELLQLGSLIPMCAKCNKVRTEDNEWERIDRYLKTHIADIDFTHGLCPDCMRISLMDQTLSVKDERLPAP
jgi:hypothetical protein